ncbi:MAG: PorP/SprF family type IX secretion system membrane protein [Bacteroidetes bacterium]|nr:PorP/SprF family type IX secretion system membrane protein [Bacteroidota bacterium]
MKATKIKVVMLMLIASVSIKAQDFHLAQYEVASLYLNPAHTGMYGLDKGDYKIYVDSRSQWRSFGVKPFFTTYLAYDMPYKIKDNQIGIGAYFINNRTGPGNFNTTGFMLSGAYDILNKKAYGKHYLTTGLQMGLFYKSYNAERLNYDAQYSPSLDGGSFDQSIESGEPENNRLNITKFDANFGLYYKYVDILAKYHPYVGLALSHLTMPNESFIGERKRLPIKWMLNGGCDFTINEEIELTPRFIYMYQSEAYEINAGFIGTYKLTENNTKLLLGCDYRHKDAVIIHLGVKQETYALRFSYDINTSYLKNYTRSRGAWEISLVITGEKGKSFFSTLPKF